MDNKRVWKFGSRWSDWGDPDTKIADSVFYRYNVAFANTHAVLDARPGDLIALADGYTIVAIGEIVSPSKEIEHMGIAFSKDEQKKYFNDDDSKVCGCIVKYYWLNKEQQFSYSKMGQFFHASKIERHVNDLFEKLAKY